MAKLITLTAFALVATLAYEFVAIAPFIHFMVTSLDHVNALISLNI